MPCQEENAKLHVQIKTVLLALIKILVQPVWMDSMQTVAHALLVQPSTPAVLCVQKEHALCVNQGMELIVTRQHAVTVAKLPTNVFIVNQENANYALLDILLLLTELLAVNAPIQIVNTAPLLQHAILVYKHSTPKLVPVLPALLSV